MTSARRRGGAWRGRLIERSGLCRPSGRCRLEESHSNAVEWRQQRGVPVAQLYLWRGKLQAHAVGDAGLQGPTADAVGRRHGAGSLNGPAHTNGPGSLNALAANNGLRSSNCHVSSSRRASVGRAGRTEKNGSGHNGGSPHGKRERAHIASAGAIAATTERGPPIGERGAATVVWRDALCRVRRSANGRPRSRRGMRTSKAEPPRQGVPKRKR